MFAIELGLFSIGTIVVPTSIWSHQHVNLITSCLNLVEHAIKHVGHVFEPPVSFDIFFKSVLVQPIKIVIPLNTFQQHLPRTFFQPKVGEMEIDMTLTQIRIKNLWIVG
jgi:hypothetical protein